MAGVPGDGNHCFERDPASGGRNKRLQQDYRQMQIGVQNLQERLRDREKSIDQIQRGFDQLLKWRDRAFELENELIATKQTESYSSAQRLRYLEDYISSVGKNPTTLFLSTFPSRGIHSFDDRLSADAGGCKVRSRNSIPLDQKADMGSYKRAF